MPSFTSLPVEVIIDNILPLLPLADISRLSATSKFFYLLTSDETFWKRKLLDDYNFSGNDTARTTGWRFIYRRLAKPKVYVWGEHSKQRLGMYIPELPITSVPAGAPYPVRLRGLPSGARIVNLVAGGTSFHALDSQGHVYVWGALDGSSFISRRNGFSDPSVVAERPTCLDLPFALRSISCARFHSAALTINNQVLTFPSWGRPFILHSSQFSSSPPQQTSSKTQTSLPIQVECGWDFTAILTQTGEVFVYWPRPSSSNQSGQLSQHVYSKDEEFDRLRGDKQNAPLLLDKDTRTVKCWVWSIDCDTIPHGEEMLVKLPDLPSYELPDLHPLISENERSEPTTIVKIAGLDCQIIGLTNKGHVVRVKGLHGENGVSGLRWEYLPYFSEVEKVCENEVWTQEDGGLKPPSAMRITHISGNFQTFTAYSTGSESVVLTGNIGTGSHAEVSLKPSIEPSLQSPHNSVISVVHGDYHSGCLTSNGKLLTWGNFSKGALGLGDPIDLEAGAPGGFPTQRARDLARDFALDDRLSFVDVEPSGADTPCEVRFDWQEKKEKANWQPRASYCFAVAAAGWHMGALVIDLEPGEEDSEGDEIDLRTTPTMPGAFPHPPPNAYPTIPPWPVMPPEQGATPPFWFGHGARGGLGGRLRHTMNEGPSGSGSGRRGSRAM